MIVLDTNVLSELMRAREVRSPMVSAFMHRYRQSDSFITAVTLAEVRVGIEIMPAGRRRDDLARAAEQVVDRFTDRILAFDERAAVLFARLWAERRRSRRPGAAFDLQIASIALSHGMTLATRNVADFAGCGLTLVNPWSK